MNSETKKNQTAELLILTLLTVCIISPIWADSLSAGEFNVYYGNLHAHTGLSDGAGTPAQAFAKARNIAGLDFYAITDHDYWPDDMTASDWSQIKNAANDYNEDGVFTAFWGFEWTSDIEENNNGDKGLGHFTVINTDDWAHSRNAATNTLSKFVKWLDGTNGVVFFNHPGQYNTTFDKFVFDLSDNIVGMELWNRSSGFSYYYNNGYYKNDGGYGYYDEALRLGWYIGAGGGHDTHDTSWGTVNDYRLAVLAKENTRTSIMAAYKARRFFSSADKNLSFSFTVNGSEMGSKINGGSLSIIVEASDRDNEKFDRIQLIKNGDVVKTWTLNSSNALVTHTLTGAKDDYFYARVRQSDKDEAISSPIFITSNGAPEN
ncbi:MAG: CehA/McbA family metallohydrolase [Gammaproteobacteria bacterium]|nr:CehA/McbA family metallohydrolase [Gammaproteobacteria bacterium]